MKRKNKFIVIEATFLILVMILIPNISAQNVPINSSKENVSVSIDFPPNNNSDRYLNRRYLIVGFGEIAGVYCFNSSWYFGGEFRGFYKGDILVFNGPGMMGFGYSLFIRDLESRQLLNKITLPGYIYLSDYVGYFYENFCSQPHGPSGFYFKFFGFAKEWSKWGYGT